MTKAPDYRGVAKIFRSGRSQVVRLPAACRFETSEVEVVKEGDCVTLRPRGKNWLPLCGMRGAIRCVTLRPRGKNWAAYFDSKSRGSIPERCQPPLLSDA